MNINVCDGMDYSANTAYVADVAAKTDKSRTFQFQEFLRTDDSGFVYNDDGTRKTQVSSATVFLPKRTALVGAINNVFGGGNAAKVSGSTFVNIGTESTQTFQTDEQSHGVKGADIRGNVYGGGNSADVAGKTNVVIGAE